MRSDCRANCPPMHRHVSILEAMYARVISILSAGCLIKMHLTQFNLPKHGIMYINQQTEFISNVSTAAIAATSFICVYPPVSTQPVRAAAVGLWNDSRTSKSLLSLLNVCCSQIESLAGAVSIWEKSHFIQDPSHRNPITSCKLKPTKHAYFVHDIIPFLALPKAERGCLQFCS